MSFPNSFVLFFSLVMVGVFVELLLSRMIFAATGEHFKKHPRFKIGSYLYLLLFPIIATVAVVNVYGPIMIKAFIAFAAIGTFFEWGFGKAYHLVVGQKLWTYHRLSVEGYTSILSAPVWGMAGILFWLLGQTVLSFL
jgi:hypothetical protein